MQWFTISPPKEEDKAFLAKLDDKDDPYYVLSYCEYDNSFREASGERYSSWDEDEILAWTTFDELDKSFDNSSKI